MRKFLVWLRERRGGRRERWDLVLEHLALQHQIRVLHWSGTHRPRLTPWDRLFWLILSRLWWRWRSSLIIVQPGTVLKWRRQGLRPVFERRHDGRWRGGRPRVDAEVRDLIGHMARVCALIAGVTIANVGVVDHNFRLDPLGDDERHPLVAVTVSGSTDAAPISIWHDEARAAGALASVRARAPFAVTLLTSGSSTSSGPTGSNQP